MINNNDVCIMRIFVQQQRATPIIKLQQLNKPIVERGGDEGARAVSLGAESFGARPVGAESEFANVVADL